MQRIPPLSLVIAMHMRAKFPERSYMDLVMLNSSAWCWVSGRVFAGHLEPEPHPLLVTAAYLYMQHVCENEPKAKAAHLFNAHELLALFA